MLFTDAVKSFFVNYFNFTGRSSRSQLWIMIGLNVLISLAFNALYANIDNESILLTVYGIAVIYSLVTFIPFVSLYIRRLHDMGYSGWWILIIILPFGIFILLILFCKSSDPENKWGSPVNGAWGHLPQAYKLEDYETGPTTNPDDPHGIYGNKGK